MSDEQFRLGQPVMFRAVDGSLGRIRALNHFGDPHSSYYVTWHYGWDVHDEPMRATSYVRSRELVAVDRDLYREWQAAQSHKERDAAREKIVSNIAEREGWKE